MEEEYDYPNRDGHGSSRQPDQWMIEALFHTVVHFLGYVQPHEKGSDHLNRIPRTGTPPQGLKPGSATRWRSQRSASRREYLLETEAMPQVVFSSVVLRFCEANLGCLI